MKGIALVAAVAAAACSSSSSTPSSEPTCDQRVDRFAAALSGVAGRAVGMPAPPTIDPVVSTKGAVVDRYGPTLIVGPERVLALNGERITAAELPDRLDAELHNMRRWDRIGPLYIWADKSTPAATLAQYAGVADALEVRVLLAGPEVAPSPYQRELLAKPQVASLRDDLDGVDPSQKAVLLARRIEEAVGTCAPLIKAFGGAAGLDAADKGAFMIDATPRALRECRCKVADIDLIEYTLLAILGAFDRKTTWVPAAQAATYFGS